MTQNPPPRCPRFLSYTLLFLAGTCFLLFAQSAKASPTDATIQEVPIALVPYWASTELDDTSSLAWGDVDNDGDLDLAVANNYQPNRLYRNDGGMLTSSAVWSSGDGGGGGLSWGDADNDGDLDLAVGNTGIYGCKDQPIHIYRNEGGRLTQNAVWLIDGCGDVAWGDIDGDSDLDLAVGTSVFRNEAGAPTSDLIWSGLLTEAYTVTNSIERWGIAWGDVDGDSDLDLAVGANVFRNEGGTLTQNAVWSADDYGHGDVAWGDIDGDGDLDLAVDTRVYENKGGVLTTNAIWSAENENETTMSVAWGDADGDGDLDLAVANWYGLSRIYRNDHGTLTASAVWSSAFYLASDVAWGDIDNDMDLDLAIGFTDSAIGGEEQTNRVYRNEGGTLATNVSYGELNPAVNASAYQGKSGTSFINFVGQSPEPTGLVDSIHVAWGDVDSDGDLDLAVGSTDVLDEGASVIQNEGGILTNVVWSATGGGSEDVAWGDVAWGDIDGDDDLDLAVGANIYQNEGGILTQNAVWSATDAREGSVAWGDIDGDNDLDFAVGANIYRNEDGILTQNAVWSAAEGDDNSNIAWGDIDNDGDLDLVVGNWGQPNRIYRNDGGVLTTSAIWSATEADFTTDVAWGDVDYDGDLDLAAGNAYLSGYQSLNRIYWNEGETLTTGSAWSTESDDTTDVTWGDVDGDGDLDLFVGGYVRYLDSSVGNLPGRVYQNTKGRLTNIIWSSNERGAFFAEWGDIDRDGDVDLASADWMGTTVYLNQRSQFAITGNIPFAQLIHPYYSVNSNYYASSLIWSDSILPFQYRLFGNRGAQAARVEGYYSLNGGGKWLPAIATAETITTNLAASPYPTATITNTHVYNWDISRTGIMGQSDNVVFRLVVYPDFSPKSNQAAGPHTQGYYATSTFPFRLRGNQIRVIDQTGQPVTNARVFRLPQGVLLGSASGEYRTSLSGYLFGRATLNIGDQLVAIAPFTSSTSTPLIRTGGYTLYHTSATPTASGLDAYTVAQSGVQTLTVSAERPLLLFNLTVSLEWDARNDPGYLAQLENDLRRTSQILFDLSNGQAALGDIAIYHDKGNWGSADVIITASNNQRPSAIMGGVVLTGTADLDLNGAHIADAYVPGQVRMGATWNRFGEAGGTLGEDWPRTLAHELGHYLFFLSDNYIGVTPDKQTIKMVDCVGSAMTDPYEEGYSEFLSKAQWTGECLDTVAARYLGRSDWESIQKFYPMLKDAPTNSGPSQLPLAVTRIQTFAPPTPPQSLAAPFFRLVDGNNTTVIVPNGRGQAYLHKRQGNSDPTDDYLIQLGSPVGDLVQARGAAPGDRLCVYDFSQPVVRLGCLDPVGTTAMPVVLQAVNQWQPQVQVTGITTNTVVVTVTNIAESNLAVQLLPALGTASAEVPMTRQGSSFVQTVTAADGAYFGHIRIWVPGSQPHKELIVEYNALEAWNGRIKFWATPTDAWGGRIRFWAAPAYAWGGRIRFWAAPVMSNDGQVSIFALDNPYANNARYTLQTVAFPPALPTWLTPVGQAYRLSSDGTIPTSAILFSYLERDVPAGYENTLQIYFRKEGQAAWQSIPTQRDPHRNVVSAQAKGAGIYLLAATVEIKPRLAVGWNDIGYTIQQTQTVAAGLASIQGHYSIVRAFFPQANPPWLTYDPNVNPAFAQTVNTLQQLEYGHGYWIHATQAVTLYLDVSPEQVGAAAQAVDLTAGPPAPAEYYGWVLPSTSLTPVEGMSIRAEIDGLLCGTTTITRLAGQLAYHLQVAANVAESTPGCGEPGKFVTLKVGTKQVAQAVLWDNTRTYQVDLSVTSVDGIHRLYLPLVNHR